MAFSGNKPEWDVSKMEEGKGVCVHGVPVNVSPARESRNTKGVFYFEANLSDGKKCARVVSFDTTHRVILKKAEEEGSVVALSNSIVKRRSLSSELEVHMNKRSKVMSSPRKLSLGDVVVPLGRTVKISDIASLTGSQEIEVKCKVVKVNEVSTVKKSGDGKELRKQDVIIADETGSCRLVLWEDDVNSLEEGKSYCLLDMGVRRYGAMKYLSFTVKSSKEMIGDLENVNEEDATGEESEDSGHVVSGEISAVISTSEYLSCKFCHSKVVSEDDVFAECTKCSAVMKLSYYTETKSAKFVVTDKSSNCDTTLLAFEPVLSRIVDGVSGRNLSIKLLKASSKSFRFNNRNVVYSIQEK